MKKIIIILFILHLSAFGQDKTSKTWWPTLDRLELFTSYEIFGGGFGVIAKGKSQILSKKHFELYHGIAYQYSYQSETDKLLNGVKGYNSDVGVYLVFDAVVYPFKTKKVFTSLELFIGRTTLKSKGTVNIPEYNIHESYYNKYSYLNYGLSQTLGYNFGKIRASLFTMISLKGLIDKGRTRPGDSDSKIFAGINLSYKIR